MPFRKLRTAVSLVTPCQRTEDVMSVRGVGENQVDDAVFFCMNGNAGGSSLPSDKYFLLYTVRI